MTGKLLKLLLEKVWKNYKNIRQIFVINYYWLEEKYEQLDKKKTNTWDWIINHFYVKCFPKADPRNISGKPYIPRYMFVRTLSIVGHKEIYVMIYKIWVNKILEGHLYERNEEVTWYIIIIYWLEKYIILMVFTLCYRIVSDIHADLGFFMWKIKTNHICINAISF